MEDVDDDLARELAFYNQVAYSALSLLHMWHLLLQSMIKYLPESLSIGGASQSSRAPAF